MKVVRILTLTIMTAITTMTSIANDTKVYELVVYKIKSAYSDNFDEVLREARSCIQKFPGMVEHQTYRSSESSLVFMDLVKWNSMEMAKNAAEQFEKIEDLVPFMKAFEEIKFMDHFELFDIQTDDIIDLSKLDKNYYLAKEEPRLVEVNSYNYLSINGVSAPEDSLFNNSIEAIYAVANDIRNSRKEQGFDFLIPIMECQWWAESDLLFEQVARAEWHWNILIPMPEFVTKDEVEESIQNVMAIDNLSMAGELQFGPINEGRSVQILHIGSYDEEAPTLEKLFKFVDDQGLKIDGKHHEIYLSDPGKTETSKLKTILRYPVK